MAYQSPSRSNSYANQLIERKRGLKFSADDVLSQMKPDTPDYVRLAQLEVESVHHIDFDDPQTHSSDLATEWRINFKGNVKSDLRLFSDGSFLQVAGNYTGMWSVRGSLMVLEYSQLRLPGEQFPIRLQCELNDQRSVFRGVKSHKAYPGGSLLYAGSRRDHQPPSSDDERERIVNAFIKSPTTEPDSLLTDYTETAPSEQKDVSTSKTTTSPTSTIFDSVTSDTLPDSTDVTTSPISSSTVTHKSRIEISSGQRNTFDVSAKNCDPLNTDDPCDDTSEIVDLRNIDRKQSTEKDHDEFNKSSQINRQKEETASIHEDSDPLCLPVNDFQDNIKLSEKDLNDTSPQVSSEFVQQKSNQKISDSELLQANMMTLQTSTKMSDSNPTSNTMPRQTSELSPNTQHHARSFYVNFKQDKHQKTDFKRKLALLPEGFRKDDARVGDGFSERRLKILLASPTAAMTRPRRDIRRPKKFDNDVQMNFDELSSDEEVGVSYTASQHQKGTDLDILNKEVEIIMKSPASNSVKLTNETSNDAFATLQPLESINDLSETSLSITSPLTCLPALEASEPLKLISDKALLHKPTKTLGVKTSKASLTISKTSPKKSSTDQSKTFKRKFSRSTDQSKTRKKSSTSADVTRPSTESLETLKSTSILEIPKPTRQKARARQRRNVIDTGSPTRTKGRMLVEKQEISVKAVSGDTPIKITENREVVLKRNSPNISPESPTCDAKIVSKRKPARSRKSKTDSAEKPADVRSRKRTISTQKTNQGKKCKELEIDSRRLVGTGDRLNRTPTADIRLTSRQQILKLTKHPDV